MADNDFVFTSGEPIPAGTHGETSFVYASGEPVENRGSDGFVFESGFGLEGVKASGDFTVTITSTNSPVGETGTLVVNVEVQNNLSSQQQGTITLSTDGTTREGKEIDLPGNSTSNISLTWETRDGDAGDYTALVKSGTDSDTEPVTVEAVDNPGEKTIVIGGDGKGGDLLVDVPYTLSDSASGDERATVIQNLVDIRFVRVEFSFDQDAEYRADNAGLGFDISSGPSASPGQITSFAMSLSFQENGSKTVTATFDNGSVESGDLIFGVDDGTGTFDAP